MSQNSLFGITPSGDGLRFSIFWLEPLRLLSENICKKTVFEPRKFFFYYLPQTEVQPPKFENLKSYLQLSADQLMPWSMANHFGHLSGRFEILRTKIS